MEAIPIDDDGNYNVDLVIEGDRVEEVVDYGQYERKQQAHEV
jgi:hypothetical protein